MVKRSSQCALQRRNLRLAALLIHLIVVLYRPSIDGCAGKKLSHPRFRAKSEGKRFTKFAEGPDMVPSGSARVELVQRATTFALLAALKAQDNPTKLNLAGMRWPNPPPKRDTSIRDLHQFSFFSYEKWSKMSAPAPLRRPYLPCRSWRCELGTRRMAKCVLGPP